mmetsp:Transcript_23901/g.59570  ORF Transcript_23901/g.59570 Transcript_23901/m.59570 type:complete len:239 (-) Transcript_23901:517-1233(-)
MEYTDNTNNTTVGTGGKQAEGATSTGPPGLSAGPCFLFPRPLLPPREEEGGASLKEILKEREYATGMFLTLGRFVGKALLDDRLVDLPFSNAFFRAALKRHDIGLRDVAELDPSLARALSRLLTLADRAQALLASGVTAQKVEAAVTLDGVSICELCLDFTLPGEAVPLCEGGGEKAVTACNLHEYVPLVIRTLLVTAVEAQLNAFRQGFEEVTLISVLALKLRSNTSPRPSPKATLT